VVRVATGLVEPAGSTAWVMVCATSLYLVAWVMPVGSTSCTCRPNTSNLVVTVRPC
jgi:hypothetical protein